MWYGPALFAFEGMGAALSVYDSMGEVDPSPFIQVVSYSYSVGAATYLYVIVVGYVGWGAGVAQVGLGLLTHGGL